MFHSLTTTRSEAVHVIICGLFKTKKKKIKLKNNCVDRKTEIKHKNNNEGETTAVLLL